MKHFSSRASLNLATTVDHCLLVELDQIVRPEGNLTPVEGGTSIPFDIARVYYLYDIPGGEARGGHAHFELEQLLIAAMGSFDVVLDDGRSRKSISLNRAYIGLYIPQFIWRELVNFSSGAICLVLASLPYSESDYIRNYDEFLRQKDPK